MFKIKIDKPKPDGVKISKKNVCFVTIVRSDEFEKEEEERQKLIAFYLAQQNPDWASQFKYACMLGHNMDEEDGTLIEVDPWDAFCHFCAIFWKVLFAIIPPAEMCGGYPAFVIALALIGVVTYVVGDVATILGCSLGIKESVTAITFVALGTSLPDTFASMTAARNSDNADSAIGNITGSNSVNVFLGLGLPWMMGAFYWQNAYNMNYKVKAGPLAFSVFVFVSVAIICFIVLIFRRICIGGELGGNHMVKYATGCFLFFLWFVYILMSTLQAYDLIKYP